MSQRKNYYSILNVPQDASQDDIKHSYRKMAQKYHPDVNKEPGAEEKMKAINEAYDVLGDPDKRAYFDRFGSTQQPQGNPYQGQGQYGGQTFYGFNDIFAEMMRQQQQAQQQYRQQQGQGNRQQYQRPVNPFAAFYRFIFMMLIFRFVMSFFFSLFA